MKATIATIYSCTFAMIIAVPGVSLAERTLQRDCPFSCATENIPKAHCKDWREGNTCYVTDLRKEQKHANQKHENQSNSEHGRVTAHSCPHNCETARLAQRDCRDWRDGNTCYVEDLRRSSYSGLKPDTDGKVGDGDRYCDTVDRRDISAPRIEVSDVRAGGFFSSESRIEGTVEGSCLTEAGYFERGRKVRDIPVNVSRDFSRYNFDINARPQAGSEIRAYNKFGDYDVFDLERERYER